MTEYDYSPDAYERHLAKQVKIASWVKDNRKVAPCNPFTPATPHVDNVELLADVPVRPQTVSPPGNVYGQQYPTNTVVVHHHRPRSRSKPAKYVPPQSWTQSYPAASASSVTLASQQQQQMQWQGNHAVPPVPPLPPMHTPQPMRSTSYPPPTQPQYQSTQFRFPQAAQYQAAPAQYMYPHPQYSYPTTMQNNQSKPFIPPPPESFNTKEETLLKRMFRGLRGGKTTVSSVPSDVERRSHTSLGHRPTTGSSQQDRDRDRRHKDQQQQHHHHRSSDSSRQRYHQRRDSY